MGEKTKKMFIAFIRDYTDSECLSRRMASLKPHLADVKKLMKSKVFHSGSVMLNDEGKLCGSIIYLNADSEQEVREIIEKDMFYKNNVWDKDSIIIQKVAIPRL
ncbi:hypothetical protein BB559_003590 [Furculomyces boomerangus]|uniref:YCII-related domain-containing protein n=2 Tax=Harpellales TaxID=61421 RepID=A0A2T9YKA1_9FUNG|nr:hypothetical protein BB559_003590 [Furculomyces boomerangus]PWA03020.1 hypothetical protein BB558_000812 [Smittium angustum]